MSLEEVKEGGQDREVELVGQHKDEEVDIVQAKIHDLLAQKTALEANLKPLIDSHSEETKNSVEVSVAKIEAEIAELDKQITELELQTPGGKERVYERRVSESLDLISNKKQDLGNLASRPDSLVDTLGPIGDTNDIRQEVVGILATYGPDVAKEAIFRNLSNELQRIRNDYERLPTHEFGNSDEFIRSLSQRLKALINFEVAILRKKELENNKNAGEIIEKYRQYLDSKEAEKEFLPKVAKMRLEHDPSILIKSIPPLQKRGRLLGHDFQVELTAYVSNESRQMIKQIEDLESQKRKIQEACDVNAGNTPRFFWSKKAHVKEAEALKGQLAKFSATIEKKKAGLKVQQQNDRAHKERLDDLALLVLNSGLSNEVALVKSRTTIGEFLDEVERLLKEKAAKKLTPEEDLIRAEYTEAFNQLARARNAIK